MATKRARRNVRATPDATPVEPQCEPALSQGSVDDVDASIIKAFSRQSAIDSYRYFKLSKPKNGLHLWHLFHAYTRHDLPLPDDVYKLLQALVARVVSAKTPDEVQRALHLTGRQGARLSPDGVEIDKKNYWIAANYEMYRSGARKPHGKQLNVSEINQRIAKEHKTTPGQVKNIARELNLTKPRGRKKIPE